jgi:phosphohistidine swiveling domain-containing protein
MVRTALSLMGMAGATRPERLMGVGIGTSAYRGRARIAASSEDAIENVEPGDVLVVRVTSPAFNAVLPIAGAVVTTEGGPLSHAAVLARELGIPAVVGAAGALDLADGATVEVDPRVGSVRVVT